MEGSGFAMLIATQWQPRRIGSFDLADAVGQNVTYGQAFHSMSAVLGRMSISFLNMIH